MSVASASAASAAAPCAPGARWRCATAVEDRGSAKIGQILAFKGLQRAPVDEAGAGDIVAVTGIEEVNIGLTLCDPEQPEGLPPIQVDEPTLAMTFQVNTSPLAGREGKFVTSRQMRERLYRELQSNVALRVEDTADADAFRVLGRGELHLTILIENHAPRGLRTRGRQAPGAQESRRRRWCSSRSKP